MITCRERPQWMDVSWKLIFALTKSSVVLLLLFSFLADCKHVKNWDVFQYEVI